MKQRKKLIEVALPLEAINIASAREKSIRHGHPSTLHLWWARRPLAAARAVIFAQMVDDPSDCPELFPTDEEQERERQRLFKIIEELVKWENTNNEKVLQIARDEIWKSWRRACEDNDDHPRAAELFNPEKLPAFHDPFAGGGALPLEAQRLGLEAWASDLNPVAVMINKAMIEIPPRFAGMEPVNPEWQNKTESEKLGKTWKGAQGLAEDVRYYGEWMRKEAEKRIGHLYPKVKITQEMVDERPDLKQYLGESLAVIAWIWARTVKSPNPAYADVDVPLATTFMLSAKKGKEAYVEPVIENGDYRFIVKVGKPTDIEHVKKGTKLSRGANFQCLMSGAPLAGEYIKAEGKSRRLGARLMAIVAEGKRGRIYISPTIEQEKAAFDADPSWIPENELIGKCRDQLPLYGMTNFADIFSSRQLVALTTFSDLISKVREQVSRNARDSGLPNDSKTFCDDGVGTKAYADAVGVYLAFAVDYASNYWSVIATPADGFIRGTFSRQALPMTWDYAEAPPFGNTSGNWLGGINWISKALMALPNASSGSASQADAAAQSISKDKLISTDPPYYDNIAYADLSDFFYVWLRRSMRHIFPKLFATLAVPKTEELVATAYRHGSKQKAESFFLDGMTQAMYHLANQAHPAYPVTIYYAFKQSESDKDMGTTSTGWDTFLAAIIKAGFAISGTWPMRTERGARSIGIGTNALASSIILVCRKRILEVPTVTRREFVAALKYELPIALRHLQEGNVAPVDLAQAAIGPGMAVYTRYAKVLDADGNQVPVREALILINQVLDETLAEQEGEFDSDTRWAVSWFEQSGFSQGAYGVAEVLARAKNTSVAGMVQAGILSSSKGKVKLLKPEELPKLWDPEKESRLTTWEMVHHLIRINQQQGESAAATVIEKLGSKADLARDLAYRLYSICERKKHASGAIWYNGLVQSWTELTRLAQDMQTQSRAGSQSSLFEEEN